jgi:hypothetical protein
MRVRVIFTTFSGCFKKLSLSGLMLVWRPALSKYDSTILRNVPPPEVLYLELNRRVLFIAEQTFCIQSQYIISMSFLDILIVLKILKHQLSQLITT